MAKKVSCQYCTRKIDARSIAAHENKHVREQTQNNNKLLLSNGPVLKVAAEKTVIVSKDLTKALLINGDTPEPVKIVKF